MSVCTHVWYIGAQIHFIETKIDLFLNLICHFSSPLLKMTFLNINETFVIKTDQFYRSVSPIFACFSKANSL